MPLKSRQFNRSISRILFLRMIGIITVLTLISILYFVFHELNRFEEEKQKLKDKYYATQKRFIQSQVEYAVSYINYKRDITKNRLQEKLVDRVNTAHQIATNIYEKNKGTYTKSQIKRLIKEALRPIRYDNGRGYYFIGNFNGLDELYPVAPAFEGKNLLHLQDEKGSFVMQDEIREAKKTEGGFVTHYWKKPGVDSGMIYPKLSYVKAFKPLNWYIGTGEYIDDFTRDIQQEVLDRLSTIRYGKEGYVFVNTYNGKALITDGEIVVEEKNIWELEDPNGVKVIQEERKAAENPEGDFIYYVWNKLTKPEPAAKISFIKGIPEWEWMVGAGVYVDEIENEIVELKADLNKQITTNLLKVVSIILFIYMLLFIIARRFSRKVQHSVKSIDQHFHTAAKNLNEIDENEVEFSEFKDIVHAANLMIRERQIAEKNLVIEKTHFEKLFENAPAAILILNKDSFIDKTNKKFLQTFHFNSKDIIDKNIFDCLPFARQQNFSLFLEQLKSGSTEIIQIAHTDKDKQNERIFSVAGTNIIVEEEFWGTYLLFSDITEEIKTKEKLKEAKEKAEESDKLKTAFLSNMSHEIRTPMNAIIGFSDLLSDPEIDAEAKANYITIIKSSGNTLLTLINDIIDIAKIESGQLQINNTITEISTVFEELNSTYKKKIKTLQKDIEFHHIDRVEFPSEQIRTDASRLKQVFMNLIENAIKFTNSGNIEFGLNEVNDALLTFYVKDTGIGIAKDKRELIFERFNQADSGLSRRYGGTGLGLTISKNITELMGGKIWFESAEGKGSTFYFSIQHNPYVSKPVKEETPGNTEIFNLSNYKILIVEDNIPNYLLLRAFLENTGAHIIHAINGKQALEEIENNVHPDIVLLDIQLPDISGYEVATTIKKRNKQIKIIAQTAFAMTDDKEKALKNHCDAYIAKPLKKLDLLQQLKRLLS